MPSSAATVVGGGEEGRNPRNRRDGQRWRKAKDEWTWVSARLHCGMVWLNGTLLFKTRVIFHFVACDFENFIQMHF